MFSHLDLAALLDRPPSAGRALVLAVDGRGGSGKSSLARWLADRVGAEVVVTDDFASWDQPFDWWPRLVRDVLEPLADGATTLSYDRSPFMPGHEPPPVVDQPVTDVLLVEGVGSGRRELAPWLGGVVLVSTPREVCLARGIARDLAGGGYESEAQVRALWEDWAQQEDAHYASDDVHERADLVVDGTRPFEDQLTVP